MTTVIQQIPTMEQVQTSPKQFKKPTRNISNLADIKTINATRFNGSPLSLATNERTIKTMAAHQAVSLQSPVKSDSSLSSSTSSVTSYNSNFSSPKAERNLSNESSTI